MCWSLLSDAHGKVLALRCRTSLHHVLILVEWCPWQSVGVKMQDLLASCADPCWVIPIAKRCWCCRHALQPIPQPDHQPQRQQHLLLQRRRGLRQDAVWRPEHHRPADLDVCRALLQVRWITMVRSVLRSKPSPPPPPPPTSLFHH